MVGVFVEAIPHPDGYKRDFKLLKTIPQNYLDPQFNFLLAGSKICPSLRWQLTNGDGEEVRVKEKVTLSDCTQNILLLQDLETHNSVDTLVAPFTELSLFDCWRLAAGVE